MAEVPRFCAGCFDVTNQVSRVIQEKLQLDLYMCPCCKMGIASFQTYTKNEILRHLQEQLSLLLELIDDVEALE